MAIITISRGSYSKGKEVAEGVAQQLGYRCISREVVLEASDHYRIPEIRLIRAIHDAPTILERFGHGKLAFVAYYQAALAQLCRSDNIVYHGLAGHLLLKGVPHLLKVRIIADLGDRVLHEMEREGIGEQEARSLILRDDLERRRWTQALYGVDPWDSTLYDLVIHIHRYRVSDAVNFICESARLDPFRTTRESRQQMEDLFLATQVKAAMVAYHPEVAVTSEYGNVLIYTKADQRIVRRIRDKAKELSRREGVNNIEVHPGATPPENAV
jgi:hypothetical protein